MRLYCRTTHTLGMVAENRQQRVKKAEPRISAKCQEGKHGLCSSIYCVCGECRCRYNEEFVRQK